MNLEIQNSPEVHGTDGNGLAIISYNITIWVHQIRATDLTLDF